jgi:hypothetical protein
LEVLRARTCSLEGDYVGARAVVDRALSRDEWGQLSTHQLLAERAASDMAEQQYSVASAEYAKAEQQALANVNRLIGDRALELKVVQVVDGEGVILLDGLVDQCRKYSGPKEELATTLLDLADMFKAHATCEDLTGLALGGDERSQDPLFLYTCAAIALDAAEQIAHYDVRSLTLLQAIIRRSAAQSLRMRHGADEDALERASRLESEAMVRYDRAVEMGDEAQRLEPRNIRIVIDLAWGHFGRWAYFQSMLGDETASSAPADALLLAELLAPFSNLGLQEFKASLDQAIARAGADVPNTDVPAERLAAQMTRELAADVLESWHSRLASLGLSDAASQPSQSGAAASRDDNRPRLTRLLSILLGRILRLPDPGVVYQCIARASAQFHAQNALDRCARCLETVFSEDESAHEAEAFYGVACIRAVENLADEAIANLELAVTRTHTGRKSAAYMGRARLDHDLGSLHQDERFQALVGIQRPNAGQGVTKSDAKTKHTLPSAVATAAAGV